MASRGGGGGGGMSSVPACDPLSSSLDRVLVDERCYESNDGIVRRREALKNRMTDAGYAFITEDDIEGAGRGYLLELAAPGQWLTWGPDFPLRSPSTAGRR